MQCIFHMFGYVEYYTKINVINKKRKNLMDFSKMSNCGSGLDEDKEKGVLR